jgi:hypothetical protein
MDFNQLRYFLALANTLKFHPWCLRVRATLCRVLAN